MREAGEVARYVNSFLYGRATAAGRSGMSMARSIDHNLMANALRDPRRRGDGPRLHPIGVEGASTFGASSPYKNVYEHFGIDASHGRSGAGASQRRLRRAGFCAMASWSASTGDIGSGDGHDD
jgi:hypothetical protein